MARLPDDILLQITRQVQLDKATQLAVLSISSLFFNIGMKAKYESVTVGYMMKEVRQLEERLWSVSNFQSYVCTAVYKRLQRSLCRFLRQ
jgi:hypothetical protein